ncbi:MAG: hypothetical protein J6X28_02565 [Bacilli bacterium]|nr:hypothetical protein [Bacilli bacterium]
METLEQQYIDAFGNLLTHDVKPMSEEEFRRCEVVSSTLSEPLDIRQGKGKYYYHDARIKAESLLDIYSLPKGYQDFSSYPITFEWRKDVFPCSLYVTFINSDDYKDLYHVSQIQIPVEKDQLSPYYLAHEYHHALKDIHPKEYVYKLRFTDTIPQFFELIAGETKEEEKDLIHNRLSMIQNSQSLLMDHFARKDANPIFDLIESSDCQYLHSFYYSVLLYELYQDYPKEILSGIREVLMGQKTTYELLQSFHLFDSCLDSHVEKGIQYLKKYSD